MSVSFAHVAAAGLIIFAAHLVGGVTGFGSGVLGLPLLALVIGLDAGKQSLLLLSTALYLYLVIRWWRQIDWRQFAIMAGLAAVGVPAGMWLYELLPHRAALIALGAFIVLVALRNLLSLFPEQRAPRWLARVMLVAGGVVHGAFTTGGPLLVVYADQNLRDKASFRVTLSLMWLSLSVLLAAGWSWAHAWVGTSFRYTLIGAPFLLAGLAAGEWLHHRVDERAFRRWVNVTLLVIGVILLATPGG
jgi:uncharacterized membrane protein YfcA